jgi:hypothetical protein
MIALASMAAIVTVTHPISDEGRTLVHEAGRVSLAFSVGCTLSSTLDQRLGAHVVQALQVTLTDVASGPRASFTGSGHLTDALVANAPASFLAGLADAQPLPHFVSTIGDSHIFLVLLHLRPGAQM